MEFEIDESQGAKILAPASSAIDIHSHLFKDRGGSYFELFHRRKMFEKG